MHVSLASPFVALLQVCRCSQQGGNGKRLLVQSASGGKSRQSGKEIVNQWISLIQ